VTNYHKTLRIVFYFVLAIQASLILFGILRPSIIYDYLDNWQVSLVPFVILIFNKIYFSNSRLDNYIYGFLIIVYSLFPTVLLSNQEILTTNTFSSGFNSDNFQQDIIYSLIIDIDGSVNLNSYEGSGYIIDIQNRPGRVGFPEVIESKIGNPRLVKFREIETDRLLQVKGWDLKLGNQTFWNLYLMSFGSDINLNNLNLINTEIIGTGDINMGKNLNAGDIFISGNFNIYVDTNLPIVVIGSAEVPAEWIDATIGYLNQTNENYKFKVIVEEGSNVVFQNGE
tara:strand:- start:341 stop:1189 length:849 start_codon:yes stop_codon:yes gene_type:complete